MCGISPVHHSVILQAINLSAIPLVCHSVIPSFRWSISLSFSQSIGLSFCQSIIRPVRLFLYSISLPFHQSVLPTVHQPIIPSVFQFIISFVQSISPVCWYISQSFCNFIILSAHHSVSPSFRHSPCCRVWVLVLFATVMVFASRRR